MWNLRYVKSLHRNYHSFVVSKACYNTRDTGKKRLCPPFEQFEPKDHKDLKTLQQMRVGNIQQIASWKMLMWCFAVLPVEVAALFGCADLCRCLQLHVACRRSWSTGVFIPTVHLTRKQKSVICEPSLHHSAEGLVSVNHSARVR